MVSCDDADEWFSLLKVKGTPPLASPLFPLGSGTDTSSFIVQ